MGLKEELIKGVDDIIATQWTSREGRVVPDSKDVQFLGNCVKLDATFLYADLADSTTLATRTRQLASEVFQCFLSSMSRVIKAEGGEIRSFDGDRVMAIFIGPARDDAAVRCGLKMHWVFKNIVKPKLEAGYPKGLAGYSLAYCTGIDSGDIWAIRGGVRNDSDLVWVGRAPNLAAKLSAMRTEYPTYITGTVFNKLSDAAKFGGADHRLMWEERSWTAQDKMSIFRSNWTWAL